jgi:hypothetical protein
MKAHLVFVVSFLVLATLGFVNDSSLDRGIVNIPGFDASAVAQPAPDEAIAIGKPFAAPAGRSVEDFLTPDGEFDLEAARADHPDDIYWEPVSNVQGFDGEVRALAVYDGRLIAGGAFTTAGGVSANCIAAWDGTSWSPLGSGMDDYVVALTVYDNQLIAAGRFTTAGGVSANYIAAWDGTSWSPLGTGTNYWVYTLTVYDNQLVVGGGFSTAGGVSAHRIAAWDGTSWSPLGSGMDDVVNALTVYDNQLIAGGYFATAGGVSASKIAAWDGTSWSPFGSGVDDVVWALTVYDNRLCRPATSPPGTVLHGLLSDPGRPAQFTL